MNHRHKRIKERIRTQGRIRSTSRWVAPGLLGRHGVTCGFLARKKRRSNLSNLVRARITSITQKGIRRREQAENLRERVRNAVTL